MQQIRQANTLIDPRINQHLQSLHIVHQYVQSCLDPALRPHIIVANLQQDCLILETTGAVWATALRYRIPDLIHQLQAYPLLRSLKKITAYIKPVSHPKPLPSRKMATLSAQSAHVLQQLATTIVDSKLRQALFNIARHNKAAKAPAIKPKT